jgi:hypothetical protein
VEQKIEPCWPEMLPQNQLELLQAAKIEKELGTTSLQTLTESIGRDPEKEKELKATETQNTAGLLGDILNTAGNRGLFGGNVNGVQPTMRPPMNGSQRPPIAAA